ncbi:hypothetical protein [Aeromicrobium sp. IC_218]|uniref:hypothetical protein n=1 Tax=Aeromicrobium sp. IC_218 TaxID=2545468 RepID=UPI001039854C|nr:hypothetical protein [Aeromicrobium sp. IC_218]TCJ00158.1 hypothetical protein E0W78_02895 [Aeromicrobium sp. IC_218]
MALVLIALQVAFRTWAVAGSHFLVDDYIFLSGIARGQDDLDWYLRIHQGHFMPLSFVLVKLVSFAPAFSWTAVTVQIAVLQLLASLAAWWMLRTIFGNRPAVVVLLAGYLFAPLTLPSVMWWAVAINQLPQQIGLCILLGAHVQYLRTNRRRWLLVALLGLLIGLASYTKTALALPVLPVVAMVWFTAGSTPVARAWSALRRWWLAWLAYGVVGLAFAVLYLHLSVAGNVNGTGGNNVELAVTFIGVTLVPTLVGGPLQWKLFGPGPISYVDPGETVIVVAWVLLGALLAWVALTRVRALRALWIPAVYVAGSIALVVAGRSYVIAIIGAKEVGLHLQYLSDAAPLIALAVGGMLLRVPGAPESSQRRADPLLAVSLPRTAIALGALAVLAASVTSTIRYAEPWHEDFQERRFLENGRAALQSDAAVADDAVPTRILPPVTGGDVFLIRNYFAPLGEDAQDVRAAGVDLSLLDVDGNPVPAFVDGEPRSAREPERCAYEASGGEPVTIPIVPIIDSVFWMQVDYSTLVPGDVAVVAGGQRTGVRLEAGEHRLLVRTTGAYDEVTIYPADRQVLCVSAVRVGSLSPEEDAS